VNDPPAFMEDAIYWIAIISLLKDVHQNDTGSGEDQIFQV